MTRFQTEGLLLVFDDERRQVQPYMGGSFNLETHAHPIMNLRQERT